MHPRYLINHTSFRGVRRGVTVDTNLITTELPSYDMASRKTVRLNKTQENAITDMAERGIADNESEALRTMLNAGMHEYGYNNGEYRNTNLRSVVQEATRILLYAGIAWLGLTVFLPLQFRALSVVLVVGGVFLLGVDQLLKRVEPRVTDSLKRVLLHRST